MKEQLKKVIKRYSIIRNTVIYLMWFFNLKERKYLKRGENIYNIYKNKKCLIVLSSPSVALQDLKKVDFDFYFFVNRGFLHPDYSVLNPKAHVIIDPKLLTGEWDFEFLAECLKRNNDESLLFILNSEYLKDLRFEQFFLRNNNVFFINTKLQSTDYFWQYPDLLKPSCNAGVFGAALNAAIYMGFKEIYFTGFEGNGLCYEMTKCSSHYYGVNPDNDNKTSIDYIRDLRMMAAGLQNLHYLAKHIGKTNIKLFNLTKGGVLDMFPRMSILDTTMGQDEK